MSKKTYIMSLLVFAVICTCLAGCSNNTVSVSINDAMTETIVNVRSGSTVLQAIEEAELIIGEKDEISPSAETQLKAGDVITISRHANVTVEYDGRKESVSIVGGTVAQAIKKSGLNPGKNYAVNYDENAFLTDGMKILITRLINVTLTVDGKTESIASPACTVAEFIGIQEIKLGKKDIVTPSLNTEMTTDTKLVIKRVETKTVTETEVIEFNTVYKSSSSLKKGESKVTQEGKNGKKKVKYKITYIDGKEFERKAVEETIISPAVDKIITRGTQETTTNNGKHIVSKQRVDDCDGSGHGYFVITWSDGSVTYEEY